MSPLPSSPGDDPAVLSRAQRLQSLAWPLIFGGLIGGGLAYFLNEHGAEWAPVVGVAAGLAFLAGVVCIVLRSRIETQADSAKWAQRKR